MTKLRRVVSGTLMFLGGMLIVGSLALTVYCFYGEVRAKRSVNSVRDDMILTIPDYSDKVVVHHKAKDNDLTDETPLYEIYPDIEMKTHKVYNSFIETPLSYIGMLRINSIGMELPVAGEWSYENLNFAPCCYSGTAYTSGFVICAHNYASHFGFISELNQGDEVVFTDVDGNNFVYYVESIDELEPSEVDDMVSNEYDLTLFTCTFTGKARIAVRCMRSFEEQ